VEDRLLIGWASGSITPDAPVQLEGQHYERVSERVRDPVTATALALESVDDGEQAIILSCDLTHTTARVLAAVRDRVAPLVPDFDVTRLFSAATHTHTAPMVREGFYLDPPEGVITPGEYIEFLAGRLAEIVACAWESRGAGTVSSALGHAALGFNRRVVYDTGESRMYGNTDTPHFVGLEGTCDHGMEMLFCWDAEDNLTGIVANPACPSQVVEGKRFVSADFWASARRRVREAYGEGVHLLPLCSAAGDQSPRDLVRRGRGEPDMRDESGLEEKGRRVARAIDYVYAKARAGARQAGPLRHHVERLTLPARRITPEMASDARRLLEELEAKTEPWPTDRIKKMRLRQALAAYEHQPSEPAFDMELHVLRIGNVAVATNPFELFLDYGLRMKALSPADQTFVVQLACDRGGYLPTAKATSGGGYGATITEGPVGPAGGEVLVARTVELIKAQWDDAQGSDVA
jgi:hypothetical protein